MMKRTWSNLAAIVLITLSAGPAANASNAAFGDNGIMVDQPKLYDDRSLDNMINTLDTSLRGLNVINNDGLVAALGRFQGETADKSSLNASITTMPTPGIEHDVTLNTDAA